MVSFSSPPQAPAPALAPEYTSVSSPRTPLLPVPSRANGRESIPGNGLGPSPGTDPETGPETGTEGCCGKNWFRSPPPLRPSPPPRPSPTPCRPSAGALRLPAVAVPVPLPRWPYGIGCAAELSTVRSPRSCRGFSAVSVLRLYRLTVELLSCLLNERAGLGPGTGGAATRLGNETLCDELRWWQGFWYMRETKRDGWERESGEWKGRGGGGSVGERKGKRE